MKKRLCFLIFLLSMLVSCVCFASADTDMPTDEEISNLVNFSRLNGYMPGVDDQEKNVSGPLIITDMKIIAMGNSLGWLNKAQRIVQRIPLPVQSHLLYNADDPVTGGPSYGRLYDCTKTGDHYVKFRIHVVGSPNGAYRQPYVTQGGMLVPLNKVIHIKHEGRTDGSYEEIAININDFPAIGSNGNLGQISVKMDFTDIGNPRVFTDYVNSVSFIPIDLMGFNDNAANSASSVSNSNF